MNIYVVSFKENIDDIDKTKLIKANFSNIFENNSAEGGKGPYGYNIGNWWYDYRYVYSNGEDHHYYRIKPELGLIFHASGYRFNAGDIIAVINDYSEQKSVIKYLKITEDVYLELYEGNNHDNYDEDFKTGGWYRLGDTFTYKHGSDKTYNTHDEIKEEGLQVNKLLIPKDEIKNIIDYSRKETEPHYYEDIITEPINSPTFITEGIVTDYISFQWIDKYFENGSFSLILPANEENMSLFKEGRYLLIGESDRCMMIEKVVFNNNLKSDGYIMEVSGRSIEAILERRVAFPGQGLNTNEFKGSNGLIKAIYNLVDGFFINPEKIAMVSADGQKFFYYPERRVNFLTIPNENDWFYDENNQNAKNIVRPFNESVNKVAMKDNLLKIISELCKSSYLGFRILPKSSVNGGIEWEFSLYTGKDKSFTRKDKNDPLLLFSPTLRNVESVATTKDTTNYRNIIFCGVEKDSDGYIDFTKTSNEATNFNQKTGIDVVDKINSGATSLITGVKDRFVTMLEDSPLCYTGIFILAMAASRKDKDYTATVTKIESSDERRSEIYIEKNAYEYLTERKIVSEDGTFYFRGKFNKNSENCIITAKADKNDVKKISNTDDRDFCKLILTNISEDKQKIGFFVYTGSTESSGYHSVFFNNNDNPTAIINKTKDNIIYIYGNGNKCDYSGPNGHELLDYTSWNYLNPGLALCDYSGELLDSEDDRNYSRWIPDEGIRKHCYTIDVRVVYKSGNSISLDTYPTNYISEQKADNIKITFRKAFGEGEGSSNKTDSFILSDTLAFKESTAFGWLTKPILNQAINDLNNINFNILERSGIQAWFKTLDKYTSGQDQKRWLCQVYEYDTENTGIDRREVFVDEDASNGEEWNASAINQFQSSTATISIDEDQDEESDEKINERLIESARKRSGEYRKKRDIDASLETNLFEYMSNDQNGYNLGDIIQVDDGWGNQDQYIITGVTISNDTASGLKKIPTFERFEKIPKQYRQLDYLQVANMILPAKFNRHFTGEQNAKDISLPPNVYFGAKTSDNSKLSNIKNIKNETIGVITDIECDLEYAQKSDIIEPSPFKSCFALISAIGSQERDRVVDPETGNYKAYNGINIPFALVSHQYKGPYHFMTDMPNSSKSESDRYINMYLGVRVSRDDETNVLKYKNGDGYNRNSLIDRITLGYSNYDIEYIDEHNWRINSPEAPVGNNIIFKPNDDNGLNKNLFINSLLSGKHHYEINKLITKNIVLNISTQKIQKNIDLEDIRDFINIFWNNGLEQKSLYDMKPTDIIDITGLDIEIYYYQLTDNTNYELYINLFVSTQQYRFYAIKDDITYDLKKSLADFRYDYENNKYYIDDLQDHSFDDFYIGVNNDEYIEEIHISNMRKDNDNHKFICDAEIKRPLSDSFVEIICMDYNKTYEVSGAGQQIVVFEDEYDTNKDIYYTTTKIDNNENQKIIHEKPLVNALYNNSGKIGEVSIAIDYYRTYSGLIATNYFINKFSPISINKDKNTERITQTILNGLRNKNNLLYNWLVENTSQGSESRIEYTPMIDSFRREILIDETGYGQDNYRMPKYISNTDEPYSQKYNDLPYENNIVLGGCGFYRWDDTGPEKNYLLKFYDETVIVDGDKLEPGKDPLANIAPRACDTSNGVRVYDTIKVYETICSTRQIWFGDSKNDKACMYNNDTDLSELNPDEEIKAYYPDLSTRKLVHEYVPVRYIEGGNDILKEEEYGFYDIIDKIFVPINWGGNNAATFIQAGGEINNE